MSLNSNAICPLGQQEVLFTELQEEVQEFQRLERNSQDEREVSYLLSLNWLKSWKQHASYERLIEGKEPNYEFFGRLKLKLSNANSDLIRIDLSQKHSFSDLEYQSFNSYYSIDANEDNSGNAIILKEQLKEQIDYILVDIHIINLFRYKYCQFNIISRRAFPTSSISSKKITQIYYPHVNLLIINHQMLKAIDIGHLKSLQTKKVQVCVQENQNIFQNFLINVVKQHQYQSQANGQLYKDESQVNTDSIRLWKLEEPNTLESFYQDLASATNQYKSFNYRFNVPIQQVQSSNDKATVEQLGLISNSVLVVEVKNGNNWLFKVEGEAAEEQCSYCRTLRSLKFECQCRMVRYCSYECKLKDTDYHFNLCESRGYDPEDFNDFAYQFTKNSVNGVCGLYNVGNSCFMSCALQCLSNTPLLTPYFLLKKFKSDINYENILGSQGQLAWAYSILLKNMWVGTQSIFSPHELKNQVSQLQSRFSGSEQHDSQEFLSYLLDGLHEDLNRVKVKQYTENMNSNGRDDKIVSSESWRNHMKRNQSIIVDLMQGQFKSKVSCPDCNRESITFDPFLYCTLPIPNRKQKSVSAYFIFNNNRNLPIEITYNYESSEYATVRQFKLYCSEYLNCDVDRLSLYSLSFRDIKRVFEDKVLLKEFKKQTKYGMKNAVMIEYGQTEQQLSEIVVVQFVKYSSQQFTFARPFKFNKNESSQDIHLRIFEYLVPVILQAIKIEQNEENTKFMNDFNALDLHSLYNKYILSAKTKPYCLVFQSNKQSNLSQDIPCFFCGSAQCQNCEVPYDRNQTIESLKYQIDCNYEFKLSLQVVVSMETQLGSYLTSLHSLGKMSENNQEDKKKIKQEEQSTLENCLFSFQLPESLGENNFWYCSECQDYKNAEKQILIYRTPEILILHLKRFQEKEGAQYMIKTNTVVQFPLKGLDMTDYVIEKESPADYYQNQQQQQFNGQIPQQDKTDNHQNSKRLLYDLYAVSNHYGCLEFGHYTAYALNNNQWYCFDDQSVMKVREDQIVSEASYILFYQKRKS